MSNRPPKASKSSRRPSHPKKHSDQPKKHSGDRKPSYAEASPSNPTESPKRTYRRTPASNAAQDKTAQRLENQQRQATEFWREWLSEDKWYQLDRWLKITFSKNKKFGKRDRLIYGDALFTATRFAYFAATIIRYPKANAVEAIEQFATQASNAKRLKQQLRQIAESNQVTDFMALCEWRNTLANADTVTAQGDETARSEAIQKQLKTLPTSLSDYRNAVRKLMEHAGTSLHGQLVWHGIPVNYAEAIADFTSPQSYRSVRKFLSQQDTRPPLWLRSNHAKHYHAAIEELNEHYTVTTEGEAIAINGSLSIYGLECYKNGWVEVQDWASQQLAKQVDCAPGQKVWDACAGGGGKTIALAAKLENKGTILATDIREHKLAEVKRRAKQAQFFNIRAFAWQGDAALKLPKEIAREGGFDWVLVDAPCSSSGTWRRNPDAKLRNTGEDLSHLTALQLQILLHASESVKAGGHLVYGTCSFFKEENEDVIANFLANNSDFEIDSMGYFGSPNNNSDALFHARLKKI